MEQTEVDGNAVIHQLRQQRNGALDALAIAEAQVSQLRAELAEARKGKPQDGGSAGE